MRTAWWSSGVSAWRSTGRSAWRTPWRPSWRTSSRMMSSGSRISRSIWWVAVGSHCVWRGSNGVWRIASWGTLSVRWVATWRRAVAVVRRILIGWRRSARSIVITRCVWRIAPLWVSLVLKNKKHAMNNCGLEIFLANSPC